VGQNHAGAGEHQGNSEERLIVSTKFKETPGYVVRHGRRIEVITRTYETPERQGKQGMIGCPRAFLADVCRLTKGRAAVVVALCIYRRTIVRNSKTVTLPAGELKELGVSRQRKLEALGSLRDGGLIKLEKTTGCSTKVTLTWKPQ
jgi:hypothetical protein